jgi:hypothetical protein
MKDYADTLDESLKLAWFMWNLEQYYREAYGAENYKIKSLFGFPYVRRWNKRKLSFNAGVMALQYEINIHVEYLLSLPLDSQDIYRRASERISRKFEDRWKACHDVWFPIFQRAIRLEYGDYRDIDYWCTRAICTAGEST